MRLNINVLRNENFRKSGFRSVQSITQRKVLNISLEITKQLSKYDEWPCAETVWNNNGLCPWVELAKP